MVKFGSVARNSTVFDWMTKSRKMMFLSVRLPLLTVAPGLVVLTAVWLSDRYSPSTTKAERVCVGSGGQSRAEVRRDEMREEQDESNGN